MPEYIWRVSFILNGARCEQTVSDGDWSINKLKPINGKKRVQFTRRFKSTEYQDYWHVYDSAKEQVDELLDAMSISQFTVENIYFPKVSDFEVVLENVEELIRAGQPVPSHGEGRFTYRLVFSNAGLAAALKNVSKIASSSNRDIIRHCLHIYRRGLSYANPFDKFFAIWRAFNAIYNHFSAAGSETQRIKNALQKLDQNDRNRLIKTYSTVPRDSEPAVTLAGHKYNLFDYLVSRNLVDNYGRNRSQELKQALFSGLSEDTIERATLCLYVVRCKYVHGSASQIMKQERLFNVSSAFLSPLLILLLNKLL